MSSSDIELGTEKFRINLLNLHLCGLLCDYLDSFTSLRIVEAHKDRREIRYNIVYCTIGQERERERERRQSG